MEIRNETNSLTPSVPQTQVTADAGIRKILTSAIKIDLVSEHPLRKGKPKVSPRFVKLSHRTFRPIKIARSSDPNLDMQLVDGWGRFLTIREKERRAVEEFEMGAEFIEIETLNTFYLERIRSNIHGGKALSSAEKVNVTKKAHALGATAEEIAGAMSEGTSQISVWLAQEDVPRKSSVVNFQILKEEHPARKMYSHYIKLQAGFKNTPLEKWSEVLSAQVEELGTLYRKVVDQQEPVSPAIPSPATNGNAQ